MALSRVRVSSTECLLISVLLFSVPIPILCRQQLKTSHFAASSSSPAWDTATDGVREKRLASRRKEGRETSCCVCGVAIYKATFISKWNKTNHPNDFPDKLAHFSSVIGGTHTGKHVVWKLGALASPAVKKFTEWGDTRSLLNPKSRRGFLGIIKTSPIYRANEPVSDRFRADKTRHYLSFLSKITPSPDWFVGVDSFDLCNTASCTWKKNVTLQLRPVDAGTDSGLKFTATNRQTVPSQVIHLIHPDFPKHPDASFFNRNQKRVPPMAEFKIELFQTKGRCSRQTQVSAVNCKVSRWSSWTTCSTSCGRGKKERKRNILVHPKNGGRACPTKLHRIRSCRGRNCTGKADCQVKNWSKWSACSKTCGRGRRTRRREIAVNPRGGGKKCPSLVQKVKCRMKRCPTYECKMSSWSNWSNCSKHCGRGRRKRTRVILKHNVKGGEKCKPVVEKQTCNIFKCRGLSRLSGNFSG